MSIENRMKIQVEIFEYINNQLFFRGGVSKQEIADKFSKDASDEEIDEALELLLETELIQVENEKYISTGKPLGHMATTLLEKICQKAFLWRKLRQKMRITKFYRVNYI